MTFNADPFVASVLILILMEYSLRLTSLMRNRKQCLVLILILMEYSLRQQTSKRKSLLFSCLNPYSNGI